MIRPFNEGEGVPGLENTKVTINFTGSDDARTIQRKLYRAGLLRFQVNLIQLILKHLVCI